RRSCTTTVTSGARSASSAATWPRPWPATTISRRGDSSRAALITWPSIVSPPTGFSTLGMLDFIRVPSPAARTITAAGTLALTQLLGIGAGPRGPAALPRAARTRSGYLPPHQPRRTAGEPQVPAAVQERRGNRLPVCAALARARAPLARALAPGRGFEPRLTGPKPVVMPLDHPGQQLPRLLYRELPAPAVPARSPGGTAGQRPCSGARQEPLPFVSR